MLLTENQCKCLEVLPADKSKEYQFRYNPKNNDEKERKEYRELDESYFDILGYHIIVNYQELQNKRARQMEVLKSRYESKEE